MRGKLKDLTLNRDGTQNITVTVRFDFRETFDRLAEKDLDVEIKQPGRSAAAMQTPISM